MRLSRMYERGMFVVGPSSWVTKRVVRPIIHYYGDSTEEQVDLDTLSSSIAFAYLSSTLLAQRTVPLILTPPAYMPLRPENLLALNLANLPLSTLLHPEYLDLDLGQLTSLGANYALVDHNRLLPPFGNGTVEAIIDHHDDEHAHQSAAVRIIQVPTGSCASLVAQHFMPEWNAALSSPAGQAGSPVSSELADLLLTSILIDTGGLKQNGKATTTDYEAAAFLYPISTLSTNDQMTVVSTTSTPSSLTDLAQQLMEAKFNVSEFTTHDLLLRDYKEYTLATLSSTLRVGLSTVPQNLKVSWSKEGPETYLSKVDEYMAERDIDIEGILTSYNSENKGKHKREILLVVRSGGSTPTGEVAKIVLGHLAEGLEANTELRLENWSKKGLEVFADGKGRYRVWQQGNTKATRKQVAPLLVSTS